MIVVKIVVRKVEVVKVQSGCPYECKSTGLESQVS